MAAGSNTSHDIHIWQVDLTHGKVDAGRLDYVLSDEERHRAARLHLAVDRDRFTIRRAALRNVLGAMLEVNPAALKFIIGSHGKPRLDVGNVCFSTSHSGTRALIAVARDRELGVDIEAIRPSEHALSAATRFFSADEVQRLSALTDSATIATAFYECWTRKEAFIKAIGKGLSHSLDSFSVTFLPDDTVGLRTGLDGGERWALVNIDAAPGYRAALVFERTPDGVLPRILVRQWQPVTSADRCSFTRSSVAGLADA